MGSGSSGLYSGTAGSSQPISPLYGVTPSMREYDIERGVYNNEEGYARNPTAQAVSDSISNGKIVGPDGKPLNGTFTYVVTSGGDLIIGKRNGNGRDGKATPHPTLVGRKNPQVQMAGMVQISNGKIVSYDNRSGHFKPNAGSMPAADTAFGKLPTSVFKK